MIPVASLKNLTVQMYGGQLLIYDRDREQVLRLNFIASLIWNYCDGTKTIVEIVELLERRISTERELDWGRLVWQTMDCLEKCNLIAVYRKHKLEHNISSATTFDILGSLDKLTMISAFPEIETFSLPKSQMKVD